MYVLTKLEDVVRIPPHRFGEDRKKVIEELVHTSIEGTMKKDTGLTILAASVESYGEGIIIHGDGAIYQKVKFDALVYRPELQEVVDGDVVDVVEFGAFIRMGPLDALCHTSQITDDFVKVNIGAKQIEGTTSKRRLSVGDSVKARIVSISLNELNPRESKIGLTMRQPGMGRAEWFSAKEAKPEPKEGKHKKEKKE
jgi:DNA-directed RNA polymerase subunit E'